MSNQAKFYIYGVIAGGAAVLAGSIADWSSPKPVAFIVYLLLSILASLVKVRLPGIVGTYSLNFLCLLFGIVHFSLFETVCAGCVAALVQSACNSKSRPALVQVLFNMANLTLSVGFCFFMDRRIFPAALHQYRPAELSLVAFLYFITNTVVVSGVLALLQKKRLAAICGEWYVWYLPYYVIGVAFVGLLPVDGQAFDGAAWLTLLPVLYLVHFFLGLLRLHPVRRQNPGKAGDHLPTKARLYLLLVLTAGSLLMIAVILHWQVRDLFRFVSYLLLAAVAATLKFRLPGMRGTLSVSFVLILVAIADLSLAETALMSVIVGVIQCTWKPKRRPAAVQIMFNAACLALTTSLTYVVCQWARGEWIGHSLPGLLVIATLIHYTCNTLMVATVLCLVEEKPLHKLWQNCHFWSFPYYLVGAAAAGLMTATSRAAGWQASLAVLPMMALIYISYRTHVARANTAIL